MKPKLMAILLGISLCLNVGVLLGLGHHWLKFRELKKWPKESAWHMKHMKKMLKLDDNQFAMMEKNHDELESRIQPIKDEMTKDRAELFDMLKNEDTFNPKVEQKIEDIARVHLNMARVIVSSSFELKKILTPEQREKFAKMMEKGFGGPFGPGGPGGPIGPDGPDMRKR
jgi:Spy/CpxP family protein refolding chaperone